MALCGEHLTKAKPEANEHQVAVPRKPVASLKDRLKTSDVYTLANNLQPLAFKQDSEERQVEDSRDDLIKSGWQGGLLLVLAYVISPSPSQN